MSKELKLIKVLPENQSEVQAAYIIDMKFITYYPSSFYCYQFGNMFYMYAEVTVSQEP